MKTKTIGCILALIAAALLSAQSGPVRMHSLADITGSSTTVAISVSGTGAQWIQFVAPTTNTSVARWGGPETTSAIGSIIAPGAGQFTPPCPPGSYYPLNTVYVYVATGDKLSITYGQ